MEILTSLKYDWKFYTSVLRMLKAVKDVSSTSHNLVADDIEKTVDRFRNNPAFIDDDQTWSYADFEAYANRVAHWALAKNCKPGDTVAIFVGNRLQYVALWFGLSKIGVLPALLNYQLMNKPLAHCVNIADSKLAIVDSSLVKQWRSAASYFETEVPAFSAFGNTKNMSSFDDEVSNMSDSRPDKAIRKQIKSGDPLMKMFTSGTTGMPKAALVAHTRAQYYLRGFAVASKSKPTDRTLMVLPLYHATGGLCGVGLALTHGGAVIVRAKFSASSFWDEAIKFEATLMMYVGELCRFLLNAPTKSNEAKHKIRYAIGNGLPGDIWEEFVERFNIGGIIEFYGATEGNISLINFDGPVGAVGRLPKLLNAKTNGEIIAYDVETGEHQKNSAGFCVKAAPNEVGELIGEIRAGESRFKYDGYENKQATDKKIMTDVFVKGDRWFRTGDLMRKDERGYCYFSDRIGDTYRWKAENVSTGEVAAALTAFDGILQANVYGVKIPGTDGRAGMASLVTAQDIDLIALKDHLEETLPSYARPVFLRISGSSETTTTFKYKKVNLVKQGFDPAKVKDKLYFDDPAVGRYQKLTAARFEDIKRREVKF